MADKKTTKKTTKKTSKKKLTKKLDNVVLLDDTVRAPRDVSFEKALV
jgi:hypothetical protein